VDLKSFKQVLVAVSIEVLVEQRLPWQMIREHVQSMT
jgi:hypothetical protein